MVPKGNRRKNVRKKIKRKTKANQMMLAGLDSFIHLFILNNSFIHTEHLYSASSRELPRGASDSSTAKKSSLKLRKNPGDKVLGKIRS